MNQILGQIRQEYDEIAVKNRDEAEQWYKVRDFLPDFMAFFTFRTMDFSDNSGILLSKNHLRIFCLIQTTIKVVNCRATPMPTEPIRMI